MNFNEDQNLLKFYNNRSLNINNQFFPNNDFLHQVKIPSNISFIKSFNSLTLTSVFRQIELTLWYW